MTANDILRLVYRVELWRGEWRWVMNLPTTQNETLESAIRRTLRKEVVPRLRQTNTLAKQTTASAQPVARQRKKQATV